MESQTPKSNILDSIIDNQQEEQLQNFDPSRITTEVLENVPKRMRMVVTKRFGLDEKDKMTLEEIGKKEGVTRERVRQIEAEALDILSKEAKAKLDEEDTLIKNIFQEHGNVMAEDFMYDAILIPQKNSEMNQRALILILSLLSGISKKTQNKEFYTIWMTNKDALEKAKDIIQQTIQEIEKNDEVLTEDEFYTIVKARPTAQEELSAHTEKALQSYISLSKVIQRNPFKEWGLASWSDITPRGVKDKAYLVAKKYNKPLHFTEIAEKINDVKFDHKTAYPQTVHNELIKDNRFVLVGRGIYALNEWGYKPGTVLDVLKEIIRKNGGSMTRDEIIAEVLKNRKVRRNTIILNLQNSEVFEKIDSKTYTLRGEK